ncbi:Imm61 family immunity protein [Buchananella felis]|uniref:Imm61 family immunity protein n=1 Tax=Buchananella felis TaxID=3231492 RepID=UPI00352892E7
MWRSLNRYTQELVRVSGCEFRSTNITFGGGYSFGYAGDLSIHIFKEKGLYKVGASERYEDVFVDLVSRRLDAAERWFVKCVGDVRRAYYDGSPTIELPAGLKDVRAGYQVRGLEGAWSTLVRSDGTEVPVAILGTVWEDYSNIAKYSHIADLPVGELAQSYMDPAGAPLLSDYVRR